MIARQNTMRAAVWMIAITALAMTPNLHAAQTLAVVQDGKAGAVRYALGDWTEGGDGLKSPAGGRFLFAGKED